jgi:hypothetical protein
VTNQSAVPDVVDIHPVAGAADQRYCLHCGARRATARLEFLDVLNDPRTSPAVAAPPPVPPRRGGGGLNGWLAAHGAVLALGGLVLGTLLIGLLIGHWASGTGTTTTAQQPQIITVGGGAGAGAAAADTAAADAAAADAAKDAKKDTAKKDKKDKAASAATSDNPGGKKAYTKQEVDSALNDSSGNENLAPKDTDPNGANFDALP